MKIRDATVHGFRPTFRDWCGDETNPEEFKAWNQNLAHENVPTTFTGYGAVAGNYSIRVGTSSKNHCLMATRQQISTGKIIGCTGQGFSIQWRETVIFRKTAGVA